MCCTAGGGRIHLEHLQFRNKWAGGQEAEAEGETMKSSAAHLYIISASTVTIRDCLFPGGEEGSGGILVAEEAFYQSLLDLECQNPELRGSSGGVAGGNLRLLIDFCIFSQIRLNAAVHSNNQAVAVLSNCEVRECGGAGVRAEEGSTLNLLNCQVWLALAGGRCALAAQVRECGLECVAVDTLSTVNVRGCLLTRSGLAGNLFLLLVCLCPPSPLCPQTGGAPPGGTGPASPWQAGARAPCPGGESGLNHDN